MKLKRINKTIFIPKGMKGTELARIMKVRIKPKVKPFWFKFDLPTNEINLPIN